MANNDYRAILAGEWVNLNTLLSVAVGTDLRIQNQTTGAVYISIMDTEPTDNDPSVIIPSKFEFPLNIIGETEAVWAKGNGKIWVQEVV